MIAITRLAIFCAEKCKTSETHTGTGAQQWRAALLKVQTNGLAKKYNISRQRFKCKSNTVLNLQKIVKNVVFTIATQSGRVHIRSLSAEREQI